MKKYLFPNPLLQSIIIPWILVLFVFFPIFKGKIPLNIDWLVANHYPWQSLAPHSVHNPDIDDPAIEFYPLAHRAASVLRQGKIPLWNPYIGCGSPQLADFLSQPLDPLFLVSTLLTRSSPSTWTLLLLLQQLTLTLAVAGFLLTRCCSVLGATIGASAVIFSAPLVNWMELRILNASFICLFLALWAIERNRHRPHLQVVLTAAALAYGGLAGHLQFTFYAWILSAAYFLYRTIPETKLLPALILILLACIFGAALCAPAILPQLELLQETTRGESGRYFPMFRFGAAPWLTFFTPNFLGHPASHDYYGGYIYFRSYTTLPILYFGALPLTMILLVFRRHIPGKVFFGYSAIGLLGLLTIAGFRPVRFWLYEHLTGLFSIDPGRSAMLATVFLAVWSGEAASTLLFQNSDSTSKNATVFIPVGVLVTMTIFASVLLYTFQSTWSRLAGDNSLLLYLLKLQTDHGFLINAPSIRQALLMFGLAGLVIYMSRIQRKYRCLLGVAIFLVLAADLVPWAIRFNPFVDPVMLELPEQYQSILEQHKDPMFRTTGMDRHDTNISEAEIFPPNTLLISGLTDFRLYLSTPLNSHVKLVNMVQSRTYWDRSLKPVVKPLLDLASVKWIYTAPDFQSSQPGMHCVEHFSGLNVFSNSNVLPRLRVTGCSLFESDSLKIDSKTLCRHVWDWLELYPDRFVHQTILTDSGTDAGKIPDYATGTIENVSWSNHLIQAFIKSDSEAVVVLSDAWYPGWKAEVNGKTSRIYKANGMFRAVLIPAGESNVVFKYEPVSYRLGLFLMFVALTVVFIIVSVKYQIGENK
ncbi:YfhO family protein [bacterium]|nr:YfhO family protein [bacterium]